jgi:hypothetical protein
MYHFGRTAGNLTTVKNFSYPPRPIKKEDSIGQQIREINLGRYGVRVVTVVTTLASLDSMNKSESELMPSLGQT